LFEAILANVPGAQRRSRRPLQLQICSLRLFELCRSHRHRARRPWSHPHRPADRRAQCPGSTPVSAKVNQVLVFKGLERVVVEEAQAGDIVLVNGIEQVGVGVTITNPEHPDALPLLKVDEPTLVMNFPRSILRPLPA